MLDLLEMKSLIIIANGQSFQVSSFLFFYLINKPAQTIMNALKSLTIWLLFCTKHHMRHYSIASNMDFSNLQRFGLIFFTDFKLAQNKILVKNYFPATNGLRSQPRWESQQVLLITRPKRQNLSFYLIDVIVHCVINSSKYYTSMGNQCSCSDLKPGTEPEINHETKSDATISSPSARPMKTLTHESLPASIGHEFSEDVLASRDKEMSQHASAEDQANQEQFIIPELMQRSLKKREQVMLPGRDIENSTDDVHYVDVGDATVHSPLILKTLKKHFIFSQLTNQELSYVVKNIRFCRAQMDRAIFKQGDPSFSYYIIIEGKCHVEINKEIKKYLEAGSSFGDLGVIYNAPRSATIWANTDCLFAELNSKTFRKIIFDLNSSDEKFNKQMLESVDFYRQLNDLQKNVLASNCITEIYKAGETIFNKGDDANAFYIIKQGIVTILQKKIDLKKGQNVGINAIMTSENSTRSNSLVAKTDTKLLSLTREIIIKYLGNDVNAILKQGLVTKILKQSDIWEMYPQEIWTSVVESTLEAKKFNKGEIVFAKDTELPANTLAVLLSSDVRAESNPKYNFFLANSIIEPNKIFKKQVIFFAEDYMAQSEAYLIELKLPKGKSNKNCAAGKKVKFGKDHQVKESQSESEDNHNQLLQLKDFIVLRRLRSGNFGRVYACYNKKTQKKYAIKVMNKQSLAAANVFSYILKEQQLLRTLPGHPFLVKYFTTFKDQNFIMLVMELIQGQDLFDAINAKLPLKTFDCKFLLSQLMLVIEHLHKNKVIYRDLKPQNVMLNTNGYLTLVDMGTAKTLTIENRYKTMTIIGTPHYMAPEIILGKGYSFNADLWSLGVMAYEMACAKLPFGETVEDPFAVYQEILKNDLHFGCEVDEGLSKVIAKMLVKSAQRRMKNGFEELKQMSVFSGFDWDKLQSKQIPAQTFPSKHSAISTEKIKQILAKKHQPALQVFLKDKKENLLR